MSLVKRAGGIMYKFWYCRYFSGSSVLLLCSDVCPEVAGAGAACGSALLQLLWGCGLCGGPSATVEGELEWVPHAVWDHLHFMPIYCMRVNSETHRQKTLPHIYHVPCEKVRGGEEIMYKFWYANYFRGSSVLFLCSDIWRRILELILLKYLQN